LSISALTSSGQGEERLQEVEVAGPEAGRHAVADELEEADLVADGSHLRGQRGTVGLRPGPARQVDLGIAVKATVSELVTAMASEGTSNLSEGFVRVAQAPDPRMHGNPRVGIDGSL
jgi:hypothetical protein